MIYHVLATSPYDHYAGIVTILRLDCGDAPAGLDEHPSTDCECR